MFEDFRQYGANKNCPVILNRVAFRTAYFLWEWYRIAESKSTSKWDASAARGETHPAPTPVFPPNALVRCPPLLLGWLRHSLLENAIRVLLYILRLQTAITEIDNG